MHQVCRLYHYCPSFLIPSRFSKNNAVRPSDLISSGVTPYIVIGWWTNRILLAKLPIMYANPKLVVGGVQAA